MCIKAGIVSYKNISWYPLTIWYIGLKFKRLDRPPGTILAGYTIGVNQNQNCRIMAIICPTSLKNTFMTPRPMPMERVNNSCTATTTKKAQNVWKGKLPDTSKNIKNKAKPMAKFKIPVIVVITGRHILGKETFFKRLALKKYINKI